MIAGVPGAKASRPWRFRKDGVEGWFERALTTVLTCGSGKGGWEEGVQGMEAYRKRFQRFVAERKLAEAADKMFVNGDSFIPNVKALEPVFKGRMFAEVEA